MKRFWVVCLLIYLSLIFSTSLHYVYGEERSAGLRFLFFEQHQECKVFGSEEGILKDKADIFGVNAWKISSLPHDIMEYIKQANDFGSAKAPFKYRVAPPLIAGTLSNVTGLPVPYSFLVMNIFFTVATAILFTYYLIKYFGFSKHLSLIGGILFITMVSVTRTLPFPTIEPASFFFIILIFIAVKSKNVPLFLLSSILGVATKETLGIAAVLWFINTEKSFKNLALSIVPVLAFSLIRLSMGGSALEVNFGFDITKGEFPVYWQRLLHKDSLLVLIKLVFWSFTFLWIGLVNLKKDAFLLRSSIVIPMVILAAFLLSGQITRVIGIVFPIIIPLFLFFFKQEAHKKQGHIESYKKTWCCCQK